jgi:hypothetical protein
MKADTRKRASILATVAVTTFTCHTLARGGEHEERLERQSGSVFLGTLAIAAQGRAQAETGSSLGLRLARVLSKARATDSVSQPPQILVGGELWGAIGSTGAGDDICGDPCFANQNGALQTENTGPSYVSLGVAGLAQFRLAGRLESFLLLAGPRVGYEFSTSEHHVRHQLPADLLFTVFGFRLFLMELYAGAGVPLHEQASTSPLVDGLMFRIGLTVGIAGWAWNG